MGRAFLQNVNVQINQWVKSYHFNQCIIWVIVFNALLLGLDTSPTLSQSTRSYLVFLDKFCLGVFVIELILKLYVYGKAYFKDGWRLFDGIVILIALLPAISFLSILRALRVLRVLRLISNVPSMKRVVDALLHSIPGLFSTGLLMLLIFYVSAVMATFLFQSEYPQWFGTLGRSLYSLFQIMTLESWSMGIVRPVMSVYPYAWLFFVPFILISAFILLNFLIAIIVDAIAHLKHQDEETSLRAEIELLHEKLDSLLGHLEKD